MRYKENNFDIFHNMKPATNMIFPILPTKKDVVRLWTISENAYFANKDSFFNSIIPITLRTILELRDCSSHLSICSCVANLYLSRRFFILACSRRNLMFVINDLSSDTPNDSQYSQRFCNSGNFSNDLPCFIRTHKV